MLNKQVDWKEVINDMEYLRSKFGKAFINDDGYAFLIRRIIERNTSWTVA